MTVQHDSYPPLLTLRWLLFALILVVLPHGQHLAWWIVPTFFALVVWRYNIVQRHWQSPTQPLRLALAALIIGGVFLQYHTIFGRDAGVALLVVLAGLKLLETSELRDALLLIFLGYFLIITNFLFSQSIPTAIYMWLVMVIITATLISLSDTNQNINNRSKLRLASVLVTQAIPVMLVLFIFFPRVAGPFWSLPKDAYSGITGLSNQMQLGNIRQLIQSNQAAFRVEFKDGEIPPAWQLYWRGPVMWWTDGTTWKSSHQQDAILRDLHFEINDSNAYYDYTIMLEPHNKRWLLALDLPATTPEIGFRNRDYQLLAKHSVRSMQRYDVRSYVDYRTTLMSALDRRFATHIPDGYHYQARLLGIGWRTDYPDEPEKIVQAALDYFNQEAFRYTLSPPPLSGDVIDAFLFKTRAGFCEHYAAAFTILMRAADIPARIVTGYQGGELNPMGNYLVVRQRDAHAWAEVWLDERGWVRIDPTAAVAPERVENGIDDALPDVSAFDFGGSWATDSLVAQWLNQLRNTWDALNYSWNQWVLGYSPERQQALMALLGLGAIDWQGLVTLMVVLIGVVLGVIALWLVLRRYQHQDPIQAVYLRFCRKLARIGVQRRAYEGPLTLAQRASQARPDLSASIQRIVQLYINARYRSQAQRLVDLRQAVRRFHP